MFVGHRYYVSFPYRGSVVRKQCRFACDSCGAVFDGFPFRRKHDLHFCNPECTQAARRLGRKLSDKTRSTNIKRLGVPVPAQNSEVQAKMIATMVERHGVENSSQLLSVIEKRRQTSIKRHGVTHPMKSAVHRKKREDKFEQMHGVRNPAQLETVKQKMRATCIERYGHDNALKVPEITARVRATHESRGQWVSLDEMSAYEAYAHEVRLHTRRQPLSKRHRRHMKRDGLSIDHIYSIHDGFMNDVPPEIVGHESNLRLMSLSENARKQGRSDKTLEQLLKDYEAAR